MRISFIWQGFSGRYGQWEDGLYAAMKLIEKEHEVLYYDFPFDNIHEFNPDVVLYWEAPVTQRGKDADNWNAVCALPYKKALLFAGGPLKAIDVKDFDLVFTESAINDEDCEREGIPYKRAFGVNTQIMKPSFLWEGFARGKLYDAFFQATFADWKRHTLFAQALGSRGAVMGRKQEHDLNGYNECVKRGVHIFPEGTATEVARMINQSHCVVNTSEYWGGGQRSTLEAMACGVPVIVMNDSPKNVEFVKEAGVGFICEPEPKKIQEAIELAKHINQASKDKLVEYIKSKWTEVHYKDAILSGIHEILNPLS